MKLGMSGDVSPLSSYAFMAGKETILPLFCALRTISGYLVGY
jgi:hypothetical protein